MEVEMVREALDESAMNATLCNSYWRVSVFQSVISTQTEIIAKENLRHGDVFVTEYQSAGRGRLDRSFKAEKSSALLFSFYLEPKRIKSEWSAISLLMGLGLVKALQNLDERVKTNLKWPNDLLIGEKKVAGILVEALGSGVVIGVGLNVEMEISELPVPTATSLSLAGFAALNRNDILPEILKSLALIFRSWEGGLNNGLEEYRQFSSTLGRQVEVHLPSGEILSSRADEINDLGELILASGVRVNVGDVIHLR